MNKTLRASKAGFPCARNLWYSVNGVQGVIEPRTQKIFDVGTCLEPLVVEWLREAGWEVEYNPGSQNAELAFELPVRGGKIRGHPDCFISRPDNEYGHVLADIKTMNENSFIRWKREGTLKNKPQYVDQLHVYAMGAIWAGYKVDKLAIVGLNKNNSAMHIDFFDFDEKRFADIRKRATQIFTAEKEPEENCPAECWCCNYCEYSHICDIFKASQQDTSVGEDIAVTSDENVINAVDLLKEARELSKAGKDLEEEAKTVLDEKIRQRGIKAIKAGELILSLSERVSDRFDSTAFKAANPELYQQYKKPQSCVVYSIKEASKA